VAYLAIVDKPVAVIGQDDAAKAEWFSIDELPPLAFDHEEIMQDAIKEYKLYLSQGL
jgi:8-oxo-dGTP diphosphatase